MIVSSGPNIGGGVSPCPIGIEAPATIRVRNNYGFTDGV